MGLNKNLKAQLGGCESMAEFELLARIRRHKLPEPVLQYRVIPERKFRWDFAWPAYKVCVELHGGVWVLGRHNRGFGLRTDADKARLAQLAGWLALTFTPDDAADGLDAVLIGDALYFRGWREGEIRD